MRISETKVVQMIEGFNEEGPTNTIVIVDEKTGDEVELTPQEVRGFQAAIAYFFEESM